jgi:hypothetical protein
MWRRLRRRTFAPRRPAVYREQVPLAVLSLLVIGGSVALVLAVVL